MLIEGQAGEHIYETLLMDRTDAGLYWDIRQNYRAFLFDASNGQFSLPSTPVAGSFSNIGETEQANEGVDWLTYTGYWGNQQPAQGDNGQVCVFGHCRYTSGPNGESLQRSPFAKGLSCSAGPYLKNLGRIAVCQAEGACSVQQEL